MQNSIELEKQIQKQVEEAVNTFFKEHSGMKKQFKIFSIRHDKPNRIFITFSSAKKTDKYIETGTFIRN